MTDTYKPMCCGQPSKWVEVSINLKYFYCEKCKNEVKESPKTRNDSTYDVDFAYGTIPMPWGGSASLPQSANPSYQIGDQVQVITGTRKGQYATIEGQLQLSANWSLRFSDGVLLAYDEREFTPVNYQSMPSGAGGMSGAGSGTVSFKVGDRVRIAKPDAPFDGMCGEIIAGPTVLGGFVVEVEGFIGGKTKASMHYACELVKV